MFLHWHCQPFEHFPHCLASSTFLMDQCEEALAVKVGLLLGFPAVPMMGISTDSIVRTEWELCRSALGARRRGILERACVSVMKPDSRCSTLGCSARFPSQHLHDTSAPGFSARNAVSDLALPFSPPCILDTLLVTALYWPSFARSDCHGLGRSHSLRWHSQLPARP